MSWQLAEISFEKLENVLGVKTVIHYEGENHAETYIVDKKKGRYIDYLSIAVVNFDVVTHIISIHVFIPKFNGWELKKRHFILKYAINDNFDM